MPHTSFIHTEPVTQQNDAIDSADAQYWADAATRYLDWFTPWDVTQHGRFGQDMRWFEGGKLNASYNCLDRHLETTPDKTALLWLGEDEDESRSYSYRELHAEVSRVANALKGLGVKCGDAICICLPMIPEAVITMLACTRIGAVHSMVFAGFNAESLRQRVQDFGTSVMITADHYRRSGRLHELKSIADEAVKDVKSVRKMIVVQNCKTDIDWQPTRDVWYHEICQRAQPDCPPREMDAEDPLFIIYTSGAKHLPRGAIHTTGGYLTYAAMTADKIFGLNAEDTIWCTANLGWITGHTYILYGPLLRGATTVLYEGSLGMPDRNRMSRVVEKHNVSVLYTSPTGLRHLKSGEMDRPFSDQLRVLGTVGVPMAPDLFPLVRRMVPDGCAILDTWWQTGTGGIMMAPPLEEGRHSDALTGSLPIEGIDVAVMDDDGNEITGAGEGELVIKTRWPSMLRGLYENPARYQEIYFSRHPGCYDTGDIARRDEDGRFWVIGRRDDLIRTHGKRLNAREIEESLSEHPAVAEAAVVGFPAGSANQQIAAYVTLLAPEKESDSLRDELLHHIRQRAGVHASPDMLVWCSTLPRSRAGRIRRNLLREKARRAAEKDA
ncbi:acetate--CoA ligase [Granulosicoccaceae sp. 1_MG-2023]|nr:acetate--CoA ligase [Granulosicoccaceae sp. 1_MG-2023]